MYDILSVYLENGLRVVMHKIPHTKLMACGVWVKQGSKFESDETSGISHLIEHLKINIDNEYASEYKKIMKDISSEGVVYNGGTTKESTSYYFSGRSQNLKNCLSALYHMVAMNNNFSEELIEREKRVVIREATSFYASLNQIKERTSQALWGSTGIGRVIVGNVGTIESASKSKIEDMIRNSYTPENSVLVIVGDIDYTATMELANETFKDWEDNKTKIYEDIVSSETGIFFSQVNNGQTSAISLGFRMPDCSERERISYDMICKILADPKLDSRVVNEIRVKRGLAYNIGGFTNFYDKKGTLGITVATDHKNVEEVVKVIVDEVGKLKNGKVLFEEVEKSKKIIETTTLMLMDNIIEHLKFIGKCSSNGKLFSLEDELRQIRLCEIDDIEYGIQKIFNEDYVGFAGIGNFDIDEVIESIKF